MRVFENVPTKELVEKREFITNLIFFGDMIGVNTIKQTMLKDILSLVLKELDVRTREASAFYICEN